MGGRRYAHAGVEPPLFEVMADPIVHAVMRRDGVTGEELIALLRRAAAAINDREFRGGAKGDARSTWRVAPHGKPKLGTGEPEAQRENIHVRADLAQHRM
jgi:hypothetical protein